VQSDEFDHEPGMFEVLLGLADDSSVTSDGETALTPLSRITDDTAVFPASFF
jgi:hypothetical protein